MAISLSRNGILARGYESITGAFSLIPYSLIALVARVVVGLVFWNSGRTKVDGWSVLDKTFFLFREEYKVPLIPPDVAAYMATFAEHACPLLLWLGLASRLSALALLAMTLVIQVFVYPGAYVTHGLWAVALLVIIARGPGALSLDYALGLEQRDS